MAWATAEEVAEITGVTPSAEVLALAHQTIELKVGRLSEGTAHITARDLRWLRRAVAYQAAWLPSQPDYLTRSETSGTVIQDGAHVNVTPSGQVLAPLARRALKRLSWRGSRSVSMESTLSGTRGPYHLGIDGVVSVFDYQGEPWQRL